MTRVKQSEQRALGMTRDMMRADELTWPEGRPFAGRLELAARLFHWLN
jgi:hypothetical protein